MRIGVDAPSGRAVPKLLDLFCGAGGAAMGYHQAGFDDIVGVDIDPQPNYPFRFIQADALNPPVNLQKFDLIHASPPCQGYSRARHIHGREHPMLIEPTRQLLQVSGRPYVMENVEDAPLWNASNLFGDHGVMLCGSAFGLQVNVRGVDYGLQRHRLFETTWPVPVPGCHHRLPVIGVYGHGSTAHERGMRGFNVSTASVRREVMGMPWASRDDIAEAIPPAYTEYLGRQFLDHPVKHPP